MHRAKEGYRRLSLPLRTLIGISLMLLFCWPLTAAQGNRGELYFRTAKKMLEQGSADVALVYFNKAIDADPKHARAYRSRAFVNLEKKNNEAALRDLDRVIELAPGDAASYLTRGLVLMQSGSRERALLDFRKGCELGDQSSCELMKGLAQSDSLLRAPAVQPERR